MSEPMTARQQAGLIRSEVWGRGSQAETALNLNDDATFSQKLCEIECVIATAIQAATDAAVEKCCEILSDRSGVFENPNPDSYAAGYEAGIRDAATVLRAAFPGVNHER